MLSLTVDVLPFFNHRTKNVNTGSGSEYRNSRNVSIFYNTVNHVSSELLDGYVSAYSNLTRGISTMCISQALIATCETAIFNI